MNKSWQERSTFDGEARLMPGETVAVGVERR
jgi:hypothetical protein